MKFEVTSLNVAGANAAGQGKLLIEYFDGPLFELSQCGALRIFEYVGPGAANQTINLYAPGQWLRVRRIP